jgi:hypothetical protein
MSADATVRHASRVAQAQSPRGKLAKSGVPLRKSASMRGRGGAGVGGSVAGAGAGYALDATRVAEPTWLTR